MPGHRGTTLHHALGPLQQTFQSKCLLGRLEPKRERKDKQGAEQQGKIEGQGHRHGTGWFQDLLQVQPGEMQLSEMQVCASLQSMFQEGSQRLELQGRQGAFGHNRISLTYGYKEAQRWRTSLLKEGLQGPLHFFGEAEKEFSFIMVAEVSKALWRNCGGRDG